MHKHKHKHGIKAIMVCDHMSWPQPLEYGSKDQIISSTITVEGDPFVHIFLTLESFTFSTTTNGSTRNQTSRFRITWNFSIFGKGSSVLRMCILFFFNGKMVWKMEQSAFPIWLDISVIFSVWKTPSFLKKNSTKREMVSKRYKFSTHRISHFAFAVGTKKKKVWYFIYDCLHRNSLAVI